MKSKTDWNLSMLPLLDKYKGRKHPLEYSNNYQLVVMVILSARATDKFLNQLAPDFFAAYPDLESLSLAKPEDLHPYLRKLPGFIKKSEWLVALAQKIKSDKNIPLTMEGLTALPGIGRKSANVIMREAGAEAEGVIVDLHVLRVAPRLGIAKGEKPEDVEAQIMKKIDRNNWGEAGMAFSFLGREICRPTDPLCTQCILSSACRFFNSQRKK